LALSTWLPLDKVIPWDSIQKPRVLQCHGDKDTMIALPRALKAAKLLEKALPEYNFKMYKGLGHTVACEKELKDIEDFLEDVLKPEGSRMSSDDRSSKK
jgi:predicted esterase